MPLRTLIRILILSAVFLMIGFYLSINDKNQDKVLIREDHTSEENQSASQNPDYKANSHSKSESPKEGLASMIGKDITVLEKELGSPDRIDVYI